MPETRGTVYAFNRFIEELGGSLGPVVLGLIFESLNQNFSVAITIAMFFFIPGTLCWCLIIKTYEKDREHLKKVINSRNKFEKR
ncbi:MAG: hypothetical protein GF383_04095 [Candidatus Lokiarchaeota archaeon]|nr:hypothetical protein [Candidatus Lokiarchaeota archaeon]MBD3338935.1 hypothetical protein [Candidatus Lokiarchaeota archaeon]